MNMVISKTESFPNLQAAASAWNGLPNVDCGGIVIIRPKEGDIIFFDWQSNGFIGTADHVGIVEKVVGNTVYTIEGNSGDMCRERTYEIGAADILGFGVPMY